MRYLKSSVYPIRVASVLLAFTLVFSFSVSYLTGGLFPTAETALTLEKCPFTVILDAGHGGEDGGAVGVDGTLEKDVNLQITLTLGEMLCAAGIAVRYTRTTDEMVLNGGQNAAVKRKLQDLKNRLAIAESEENPLFVSIHANKFPDGRYDGLQVYYGTQNPQSSRLASLLQTRVKTDLQQTNRREIKAAGSAIYLLDRAACPAVLVECGFLSNPAECEKLSKEDYRKELSFSLFCGMIEYIQENGG